MFQFNDLSDIQMDALKEISNIGTGNAATALSKLLNQKIDMTVPNALLLEINDVSEKLGGSDKVMAGIITGIEGDINGMMMFLIEEQFAKGMVEKLLMGMEFNIHDEICGSALQEIGNIIAGSYLTALSSFTNLTMVSTVPAYSVDMLGSFLNIPVNLYSELGDQILFIENGFGNDDNSKGYFLLFPDVESFKKIFASLGI
ncbi:MAG TPA: CheY-P-specific phosphatase CheC [Eubacterium sp.]|nr:CheY-P-specific phosphatase CheC [Eubacterium sp.]